MKPQRGDILLSRDQFREGTLERDAHRCVFCGRGLADGVKLDAHHIMERRLWRLPHQFGGYFLNNGATCCDTDFTKTTVPQKEGPPILDYSCHLRCGMTLLSPEDCRKAAGIEQILLPDHLYDDVPYSVWGDTIMSGGLRMRGELFWDESVQTMLKMGDVLSLYTRYVRHPRTPHLLHSPKVLIGKLGDDRVMPSYERLLGKRVVVPIKMDGGQSSHYNDYMHLRTPNFVSDGSEPITRLQNFSAMLRPHLGMDRLIIEQLVGSKVTGIQYDNLKAPFYALMMFNEKNYCLSWDETVEFVGMLDEILKEECGVAHGLPMPHLLYDGIFDESILDQIYVPKYEGDEVEGYVLRLAEEFHYRDFQWCVGKYVRPEHEVRWDKVYKPNTWEGK